MRVRENWLLLYICRKKSSYPIEKDLDLSTNVAYKEVRAKERSRARDYENVEMILRSSTQLTEGADKTRSTRCIKLGSKSEASAYVDS